ncbi:hypothetical protein VNO78_01208 [Psophocarpus tetragonolobus]|uniref:Uncharacterized protein n=1 Tax=Psophocarpus tetragonolobus TaxID=3891 RepID=A0AAN9XVE8_PSOTE
MEIEDTSNGISIGFPLGLALLVALLLFICCFFCCCLHWERLQPFCFCGVIHTQPLTQPHLTPSPPHKPGFPVLMMKNNRTESLPVLMPGDEIPKFIALPCPSQPPTNERITIHVHKAAPNNFCSGA